MGQRLKLSLTSLLYKKKLLLSQLESKLSRESIQRAKSDYHSRKLPRPCGMTVHITVGCSYSCQYCYLPDMGISFTTPKVYGLTGDEMTYALLSNNAFLPTRYGTFIALGSVGEPFINEESFAKVLEYLNSFSAHLGNPVQFSTKAFVNEEKAKRISKINLPINPLVTIISLKHWRKLEPNAPDPYRRFETIKNFRKYGMHSFLFFRPILPGINTDEIDDIFELAKESGAHGVVIGGFRVTPLILTRLERLGFDLSEIKKRIRGRLSKRRQTPIYTSDIKGEAVKIAREKGLIPMLSACCANNYNAYLYDGKRVPCAGLDYIEGVFCTRCPVLCEKIETVVDAKEIEEMLWKFTGIMTRVSVERFYIYINRDSRRIRRKLKKWQKLIIETAYRRRLVFQ